MNWRRIEIRRPKITRIGSRIRAYKKVAVINATAAARKIRPKFLGIRSRVAQNFADNQTRNEPEHDAPEISRVNEEPTPLRRRYPW